MATDNQGGKYEGTAYPGKVLTRFLLLLMLGLAASVMGALAAQPYLGDSSAPSEPVVGVMSLAQSHVEV